MGAGVDDGVQLHPVEIDLLCTFAEVTPPFPLEIPSTGLTTTEQFHTYRGAREALTARGLADEAGPLGVAEEFVHLLRFGTGALDLVISEERPRVNAVVLADQGEALLITQRPDEEYRYVYLKALSLDEAIDELIMLIPRHEQANAAGFTLPKKALQAVFDVLIDRAGDPEAGIDADPMSGDEVDELVRSRGIDDRVLRNMVTHLQPVLGSGQAGLAKHNIELDEWRRQGDEFRWLDTPRGRYRLADGDGDGREDRDPGEWMSVNPLAPDEMRAGLRRLASRLHR